MTIIHRLLISIISPAVIFSAFAEVTTVNVDSFHLQTPFWTSDTSYDEGILFLKESSTQPASAKLLFTPRKVLLMRSATRLVTYTAGVDFTVDTAGKRVFLTPGSRIPLFSSSDLAPDGEKHGMHYKQLTITYTHIDTWPASVGVFAGASLPLTIGKLRQKQPVTFAIMGTIISAGFNASGFQCFDTGAVAPFQPSWGWLLAAILKYRYGSAVTFKNHSESGTTSSGKISMAQTVASERPDLVILEYGMNECSEPADTYKANIAAIMSAIKGINPATEFIIQSSTLPRADWGGCADGLPASGPSLNRSAVRAWSWPKQRNCGAMS